MKSLDKLNDWELWETYTELKQKFTTICAEVDKRRLLNKPFVQWSYVSPELQERINESS